LVKAVTRKPSGTHAPGRDLVWLASAALLYLVVYVLRLIDGDARDGIAVLYAIPVALLALRYGRRGGIGGALFGTALIFAHGNDQLDLGPVGLLTRVGILFMVGGMVGWFVDREQRWQQLRELDSAKVRRFFELSQDMLCTADADGYFVDLNPAWERTLGYTEEEIRAQPFIDLVHPDDRERTIRETAALADGLVTVNFTNRYMAKDDSTRWLRWTAILADDGMVYARATDVTREKATALELERSNEELRQFAYIASHDLNEPLRTITGFAQLLERRYEDQVDERGRDYIRRMVGGVSRMQALIADLLKLSRAGHSEERATAIESSELAANVVEDLAEQVADRDADLRIGELPRIVGHRQQLQQVFQNLISNALKFGNGGTPVVEVSAERQGPAWRFAVADNGIGIEPGQRERIFKPFERLHSRDDYAGTGIGLAICKKIVERHGGEIHVEDGLQGGSRFVFTVPDEPPTIKEL